MMDGGLIAIVFKWGELLIHELTAGSGRGEGGLGRPRSWIPGLPDVHIVSGDVDVCPGA
jgi:hypothetical protein